MKKTILTICTLLTMISTVDAQYYLQGQFFENVGNPYDTIGSSACIVDSSFYTIRYGGVQTMSTDPARRVRYLWDRFYNAGIIRKGPGSSLILLKSNKIYQYYPAQDSMAYISASISSPDIRDISASQSCIWAITNFNQIGKYDSTGWHIITLPNSYNPTHILALNDTTVFLGDITSVHIYSPSGLSNAIFLTSSTYNLRDWSIDTAQNLWMSVDNDLIKITQSGTDTTYNYNTLGFLSSTEIFTHAAADDQGNIWASTNSDKLFKYDGHTWTSPVSTLSWPVSCIAGDRYSDRIFVLGIDSILIINGSDVRTYYIGNMPYQHIKAVGPSQIATDQGVFGYATSGYYANNLKPTSFSDSTVMQYANDVTCFVTNDNSNYYGTYMSGYGTHHGAYGISGGITNTSLPDTNINCIYYSNGSYYIGTDKGLCIYNQLIYTTIDTSGGTLPSNKITFVTSDLSPFTNQQELWVGTDQGFALYTNGQWTKFDTAALHISNLNVTGILASPYYYMSNDSTVWVSTLGSGLIKLHRDGRYTLYNTANGALRDDSLYYVIQATACYNSGSIMMGTRSHGICYYFSYGDSFSCNMDAYPYYGGNLIHYNTSNLFSQISLSYNSQTLLVTDKGLNFTGRCAIEGINEEPKKEKAILWHQSDKDKLSVSISDDYNGTGVFALYDMTGRQVLKVPAAMQTDKWSSIDISSLSTSVYILQATYGQGTQLRNKIIITK